MHENDRDPDLEVTETALRMIVGAVVMTVVVVVGGFVSYAAIVHVIGPIVDLALDGIRGLVTATW